MTTFLPSALILIIVYCSNFFKVTSFIYGFLTVSKNQNYLILLNRYKSHSEAKSTKIIGSWLGEYDSEVVGLRIFTVGLKSALQGLEIGKKTTVKLRKKIKLKILLMIQIMLSIIFVSLVNGHTQPKIRI